MYAAFTTDSSMEKNGVWIDYGDFRTKIGHAGGANKKYVSYAEKKLKPLRRQMQAGAVDDKRSREIMIDIYAKTIIFDWQINKGMDDDGEVIWEDGIMLPDETIAEVTAENVAAVLRAFPKLFEDIVSMADSVANFRKEELEEESGN